MVFLWFSHYISIFLWFSYVFLWFSYGFPMVSYGFPMVFLWFSYGFPTVSYGFPMVSPTPSTRRPPFSEVRLGQGGAIDVAHHRHGGSVADHPAVGAGRCAATEVPDTWS